MGSIAKHSYLTVTFVFSVFLILAGCQKSDQFPISKEAKAPAPSAQGTTDGGGGNGLDSKVYESYIVDPTATPAYKENLAPIFDKFPIEKGFSWAAFFKVKTWYIAPVELKKLSKETLGVSFSENSTEQLAVQTEKEIWIEARSFDKTTPKDQASLILHEFVMTLYYLKFKPISELCRLVAEVSPMSSPCTGSSNLDVDKIMPAKKPRPLNEEDYWNIRRVTGYILQKGKDLDYEELLKKMIQNGFDQRLFSGKSQDRKNQNEQIELDAGIVQDLFIQAKVLNKSPSTCYFFQADKKASCQIDVSKEEVVLPKFPGYKFKTLKLNISDANSKEVYAQTQVSISGNIHASLSHDTISGDDFYFIPLTNMALSERAVGAAYRMTFLLATKEIVNEKEQWRLEAVLSLSGVITKLLSEAGKNGASCEGDVPRALNLSQDSILVASSDKHLEYMKWLSQLLKPMPPCW